MYGVESIGIPIWSPAAIGRKVYPTFEPDHPFIGVCFADLALITFLPVNTGHRSSCHTRYALRIDACGSAVGSLSQRGSATKGRRHGGHVGPRASDGEWQTRPFRNLDQ